MTGFREGEKQLHHYADSITALYELAYLQARSGQADALKRLIHHQNSFGAVIFSDARLAGFIILSDLKSGSADIIELIIHPDFRRLSGAKMLLQIGFAQARARHITDILLEVRSDNSPAISLYEGIGFAQIGVRKGYYRNSLAKPSAMDAIVMQKNITV